jgi:hypothetical protein
VTVNADLDASAIFGLPTELWLVAIDGTLIRWTETSTDPYVFQGNQGPI